MDREEIRARLADLLADILDLDSLSLQDSTTADDVAGWDSIAHVKLILASESEFGIRFSADEATAPANIGAFVDLVAAKIADG